MDRDVGMRSYISSQRYLYINLSIHIKYISDRRVSSSYTRRYQFSETIMRLIRWNERRIRDSDHLDDPSRMPCPLVYWDIALIN